MLCFQPLHDLATEATSRGDAKGMTLALKAIGNAGEPASIKRVLKFLPTFSVAAASLPNRIHADAVLALRKIARKDLAKVTEIIIETSVLESMIYFDSGIIKLSGSISNSGQISQLLVIILSTLQILASPCPC